MRLILPCFRLFPLLITGIAISSLCFADDVPNPVSTSSSKSDDEPFDAFAEATRLETQAAVRADPRLTFVTEFIEIPQDEWTRLSRDPEVGIEGPGFRTRLGELMKSGGASLIDMNVVSGMSGDPVLNRSFRFHIYPSSFEPPRIDEKNGRIVPAAFAATECWSAGCVVSGSAVISDDGKVSLSLSPEIVEQSGETITGRDESEVKQPNFAIMKFHSDLLVNAGEATLAGVMPALKPKRPDSGEIVLLVFLRADIHVPAIALKR